MLSPYAQLPPAITLLQQIRRKPATTTHLEWRVGCTRRPRTNSPSQRLQTRSNSSPSLQAKACRGPFMVATPSQSSCH